MPIPEKVKERRKELVEKVCEAMEKGTAPWQKPWVDSSCPVNAVSGRRYNGINFFNLSICGMTADGGQDPRWCTFEQAQEKGWRIKKGSKGTHIEFWKLTPTPETDREGKLVLDENGKIRMKDVPLVRNYVVFHASQIDGIEPYLASKPDAEVSLEKAERILKESGADIRHGGNRAFYNPESDYIQVPDRGRFLSNEGYYATTLHELGHWTGHSSRLNRTLSTDHNSKEYAKEELVAEMTSVFVSAETGIPQTEEHFQGQADYIQSWMKMLKEDPNVLFRAAAAANRASEEILKHERVRERKQEQEQKRDSAQETVQKSIEQQKTTVSEDVIRDLKLIEGNPKIYLSPREDGQQYKGKVLHVDLEKGYCVQQSGKQTLLVHPLEKLERAPVVGENIKLTYPREEGLKATVDEQKVRKRTRTR